MATIFNPVATDQIVNADGTASTQLVLFLNLLLQRVGSRTGGVYSKIIAQSGAIVWDLNANPVGFVVLANGSNILSALNQVGGNYFPYRLTIIQPSSGSPGTIVWPANFLFAGGVAPNLSTGNNAIDILSFVSDGQNMYLVEEGINYSP